MNLKLKIEVTIFIVLTICMLIFITKMHHDEQNIINQQEDKQYNEKEVVYAPIECLFYEDNVLYYDEQCAGEMNDE